MMLKKSIAPLALGLGFVATASAADFFLGDISSEQTIFQNVTHGVGSFTDNIYFSLSGTNPTFGEGTALSFDSTKYNLTFSSATLFGPGGFSQGLFIAPGGKEVIGGGTLLAGSYHFELSGATSGSLGGQYTFNAVTTPVPEPETYAMFLAGLGLIGAIARRRKQSKA